MDDLIRQGLDAKKESTEIDFKSDLDITSSQSWYEIIKDIIAMSNSGGGVILIGLNDFGKPTEADVTGVINIDPAVVTDKIAKYTGIQFDNFVISEQDKDGNKIAAIFLHSRSTPIIFSKPGTYSIGGGKQKRAFSQGTVYFRHGAKSEPGTTDDLRKFIRGRVDNIRSELLSGLQKVIDSPPGYEVMILPKEIVETESPDANKIRLVDDPKAPAYRKIDTDISHPYRQKELIKEVNERLPKAANINSYDILVVRKIYYVNTNENFCHCPKYSTKQYSSAFVDWLVKNFNDNNGFFIEARKKYSEMRNQGDA